MAGTIFSLAMSQRLNSAGKPEINAPLYVFAANSSAPTDAYQDYGLSLLHSWPMRTDSAGMIPPFWLPDGQYRVRFTNEAESVIYFDVPSIQAVGPSEGGGGGGGGSVDPNAIFATGDMLWKPISGARSGWVRCNARTIGSVSSGATERANADTQPLYAFLWNNFSDDRCPVIGGRGDTAAADFAANKPIGLLDMRGHGACGLDDMGNSPAGRITDGTPTVAGSTGGSEKRTLVQANLPNVSLSGSTSTNGSHTHSASSNRLGIVAGGGLQGGAGQAYASQTITIGSSGNHDHTVSLSLGGSDTAFNIMSPYRLGTWWMKL